LIELLKAMALDEAIYPVPSLLSVWLNAVGWMTTVLL
jgi:hypothetical protein